MLIETAWGFEEVEDVSELFFAVNLKPQKGHNEEFTIREWIISLNPQRTVRPYPQSGH